MTELRVVRSIVRRIPFDLNLQFRSIPDQYSFDNFDPLSQGSSGLNLKIWHIQIYRTAHLSRRHSGQTQLREPVTHGRFQSRTNA